MRDLGLIPGLERSPGGGHGDTLQYSCLKYSNGQRSLMDCSPWVCRESDMTELLSTFIGRTDAEAEAQVLWPPDVKN